MYWEGLVPTNKKVPPIPRERRVEYQKKLLRHYLSSNPDVVDQVVILDSPGIAELIVSGYPEEEERNKVLEGTAIVRLLRMFPDLSSRTIVDTAIELENRRKIL